MQDAVYSSARGLVADTEGVGRPGEARRGQARLRRAYRRRASSGTGCRRATGFRCPSCPPSGRPWPGSRAPGPGTGAPGGGPAPVPAPRPPLPALRRPLPAALELRGYSWLGWRRASSGQSLARDARRETRAESSRLRREGTPADGMRPPVAPPAACASGAPGPGGGGPVPPPPCPGSSWFHSPTLQSRQSRTTPAQAFSPLSAASSSTPEICSRSLRNLYFSLSLSSCRCFLLQLPLRRPLPSASSGTRGLRRPSALSALLSSPPRPLPPPAQR